MLGGSVLAVPMLVYVLGQSVHEATTASLVIVTAGAIVGGLGPPAKDACAGATPSCSLPQRPRCHAGAALGQAVSGTALIAAW